MVGPSSVTIGDGVVYVGNRADSSVCAFDARSLAKGACHKIDSMPDGLAYVAPRQEVWVTTPRDKSIRILDGKTLDEKAKLGPRLCGHGHRLSLLQAFERAVYRLHKASVTNRRPPAHI